MDVARAGERLALIFGLPFSPLTLHHLTTASPEKIRALFGLTPTALANLLVAGLPVLLERRRQAQGGTARLPTRRGRGSPATPEAVSGGFP